MTKRETPDVTQGDVTEGGVAGAVASVVADLGKLRGVQVTLAAAAVLLARDLDEGRGVAENVARELRITMRDLVGLRQAQTVGVPGPALVDPVAKLQDEVAARREQRRQA